MVESFIRRKSLNIESASDQIGSQVPKQVAKLGTPRLKRGCPAHMPEESAILAHAPELATALIVRTLSRDWATFPPEDRPLLLKCFQQAESSALVSLCEESLWNDFELMPALRDELLGINLPSWGT